MPDRETLLRFTLFLVGYIVLVAWLPTVVPTDTELPNVASQAGFNISAAYLAIGCWSVAGFIYFALRPLSAGTPDTPPPTGHLIPTWQKLAERCVPALAAMVLYAPPLLARYGPYIEDSYFINVLWRMQCGEVPYRDFEFLYGPLMIYPAAFWIERLGYTLQNYYWLMCFLQGAVYFLLMALCQRFIKPTWQRYGVFLLLSALILDTILGLNYIGWRILFTLLAILSAAAYPGQSRHSLLAGLLVGVQIAYSYEYGLVALVALGLLYVAVWLNNPGRNALLQGLLFLASSLLTALLLIAALTGAGIGAFFSSTLAALDYAGETGIGNFRFYWTLNSIALFGLLGAAVIAVGSGLGRIRQQAMNSGDRLLLASLLFALGALRMAIQRADIWHLSLPFFALAAILLWRQPTRLFVLNRGLRNIAMLCLLVAAGTRLVGLLPTGSYFVAGVVQGARDIASGMPAMPLAHTRGYSIHSERSHKDPLLVSLAAYLASPERAGQPVLFYSNLWELAAPLGTCASGYSFYDLPYTSRYRPLLKVVEQHPDTLVAMESAVYRRLYEGLLPPPQASTLTAAKRVASVLSSIHYVQKQPEAEIKYQLWWRQLGDYLRLHYHAVHSIDDIVILERNPEADASASPMINREPQ